MLSGGVVCRNYSCRQPPQGDVTRTWTLLRDKRAENAQTACALLRGYRGQHADKSLSSSDSLVNFTPCGWIVHQTAGQAAEFQLPNSRAQSYLWDCKFLFYLCDLHTPSHTAQITSWLKDIVGGRPLDKRRSKEINTPRVKRINHFQPQLDTTGYWEMINLPMVLCLQKTQVIKSSFRSRFVGGWFCHWGLLITINLMDLSCCLVTFSSSSSDWSDGVRRRFKLIKIRISLWYGHTRRPRRLRGRTRGDSSTNKESWWAVIWTDGGSFNIRFPRDYRTGGEVDHLTQ